MGTVIVQGGKREPNHEDCVPHYIFQEPILDILQGGLGSNQLHSMQLHREAYVGLNKRREPAAQPENSSPKAITLEIAHPQI